MTTLSYSSKRKIIKKSTTVNLPQDKKYEDDKENDGHRMRGTEETVRVEDGRDLLLQPFYRPFHHLEG